MNMSVSTSNNNTIDSLVYINNNYIITNILLGVSDTNTNNNSNNNTARRISIELLLSVTHYMLQHSATVQDMVLLTPHLEVIVPCLLQVSIFVYV